MNVSFMVFLVDEEEGEGEGESMGGEVGRSLLSPAILVVAAVEQGGLPSLFGW